MERVGTMEKWVECSQIQTIFLKWNIYFQLKELQNFEKFIKYLARKITFVELFYSMNIFWPENQISGTRFFHQIIPLTTTTPCKIVQYFTNFQVFYPSRITTTFYCISTIRFLRSLLHIFSLCRQCFYSKITVVVVAIIFCQQNKFNLQKKKRRDFSIKLRQ